MSSLPIIDISPFLPTSRASLREKEQCSHELAAACYDTGFFYITNHGIPLTQTDEILQLSRTFFLTASDAKKSSIAREDPGVGKGDGARGYQKVGENVTQGKRDWHEAVDLYRNVETGEPPHKLCHGPNLWPDTPKELKRRYEVYIERLLALGEVVVRAMGFALDPKNPDIFVEQTRNSFWVMRMIGYPPLPLASTLADGEEGGISCGEHTDYGCLTFLLADDTKGALQVQHRSGAWMNADPVAGAFVVNIGDMIENWTNGMWKSTKHRVVHTGTDWRVSVPFFFEPDFTAHIKPLDSCVKQTGDKPLYDETIYGDHLLRKVGGNFYGGG